MAKLNLTAKAVTALDSNGTERVDYFDTNFPGFFIRVTPTGVKTFVSSWEGAYHAEPGVTAVYDRHSYEAEKKDALGQWASKLMRIVSDLDIVNRGESHGS